MRSLGAAALVLAIITECFGAQSDRSRQRSGPIRSVPVAADIKRDVDFDCPEEFGYYPHPSDCTLYYVCVFGGALLESCTGGLMYSHELQTCDWPRNVGCDGISAAGGEELERISEREPPPPPPPPRRTPPPPPPRVQPNPVITSRGQPKFNRQEYEKQQQLYAEVDDLPPIEEIETDRQQRVYRGQPSTIGQVQKDRDGYSQISSSRALNSNIIPSSISQNNGKIGSFSFGTQVDDRRSASVTQAPQTYSEDVTDTENDRQLDIITNEINVSDVIEKPHIRRKRNADIEYVGLDKSNSSDGMSERIGRDEEMEYVEFDTEKIPTYGDERGQDEGERGKRQIRYYLKNGYKIPGKAWGIPKQINLVDLRNFNYNPNVQRHQSNYNGQLNNNLPDNIQKPQSSLFVSSLNPFHFYQPDNEFRQKPFKASLPDPTKQTLLHNSHNVATQIITKSPPISALRDNNNPFSSQSNSFYSNLKPESIFSSFSDLPNQPVVFPDSSQISSTVVTGKPIPSPTSPKPQHKYKLKPQLVHNGQYIQVSRPEDNIRDSHRPVSSRPPVKYEEYDTEEESNEDDEEESSENESSEKDSAEPDDDFRHDFPNPPYEFTNPHNRFKDIENPFANPNFDFDAYLTKLSGGEYSVKSSPRPLLSENLKGNPLQDSLNVVKISTPSYNGVRSSTINYQGMSTPQPFKGDVSSTIKSIENREKVGSQLTYNTQQWAPIQKQSFKQPSKDGQEPQQSLNQNIYQEAQPQAINLYDNNRPRLGPPNFKDDRQLPISYSFNKPIQNSGRQSFTSISNLKDNKAQVYAITPKPYVVITGTGSPILLASPKQQYSIKPDKFVTASPQLLATGKPYFISSAKPQNSYIAFKQSTAKPLTTLANEHLAALQNYWGSTSPRPESYFSIQSSLKPSTDKPDRDHPFSQTLKPSVTPNRLYNNHRESPVTTTSKSPLKRRPIPKPSPEMNDYYYDEDEEDEQYYYEPPVKSKYMPSSEVKPQRPPMAQNYKEYDDRYEDNNIKPPNFSRKPTKFTTRKPDIVTKNYNDVSVVTKGLTKDIDKNVSGKIPIPVLINYATPASVLARPEISNYEIIHHAPKNRTFHMRKPITIESGPFTSTPPKYLNQTTLRPYTVRHRLAKPTTVSSDESIQRGRTRHQNIVAQTIHTTPRDNHNQETRYTKTKYDDRTNSLEPTESVSPVSYSASPRPKMLYNGSQAYNPDQYDPFYAVYDEDGELYKDTDYVQQYNTASVRPAVQQTYRGTPPSARRPVDTYTRRPVSADDYDDALIQGQINNQNQYQSSIRHSTRGDGNELGFDHNPSSVKTTFYEATSISTTPSTTTSTSTTTQRTTTAPLTEAMTPSRYTVRSSTVESPTPSPNPSENLNTRDESKEPEQFTSNIYLSSQAKPFSKTDNSHRLKETLLSTTKPLISRDHPRFTQYNKSHGLDTDLNNNGGSKKVLSLTSGFSIRRNVNNSDNTYTLTLLTRPFENIHKTVNDDKSFNNNKPMTNYFKYDTDETESLPFIESSTESKYEDISNGNSNHGKGFKIENQNRSYHIRTKMRRPTFKTKSSTETTTSQTKYYIKGVIRRPITPSTTPFIDNAISTDSSLVTPLEITTAGITGKYPSSSSNDQDSYQLKEKDINVVETHPDTSIDIDRPFESDSVKELKNINNDTLTQGSTTVATSTRVLPISSSERNLRIEKPYSKPSYYAYSIDDEIVPDHTTEVFSGRVKNVLRAFFNNFASTPTPRLQQEFSTTTLRTISPPEEKIVNIGFQKKMLKYEEEKPLRSNVKRLQIITEPSFYKAFSMHNNISNLKESDRFNYDFSSTPSSLVTTQHTTTPIMRESSTDMEYRNMPVRQFYDGKFEEVSSISSNEKSKFHKLLQNPPTESVQLDDSYVKVTQKSTPRLNLVSNKRPIEIDWNTPTDKVLNEIASTTGTTKSTSTTRFETVTVTKSLPFPTRASRVNPAIKLAATNLGGGRRSYQTPTKCSSDDSLQANPNCNEIKYQRPTSTRGRGSAHYSTGSEAPQPIPNRGTPPTRSRPTLKPSTAIVSKSSEFVDIYVHPPSRPPPVYPQPTPDKTAAKCRKDVCLLPDCYCGGKDIPGNLPVSDVPQIVLITFDDAVNDLNKMYYEDLFQKGRLNPNGCPITATFYVSHEWTDYSQVQNLYADGHEFASHTISHSFGEQFSQKKWNREVGGQREILAAYGGVKLEDVRGMRAPFLSVGGNKMFKMLHDSNFTYDSSLPVYENRPPSWPYTLDYKLFHDCMIPPCPTKSYPGVWEVPMVMWQDLNGGRCSMGDACANPPDAEGVYKMILKNFDRHYTTNRAPFGLYYHAAWFTQPHHKEGFIMFMDFINQMNDVWIITNWQALQWVRDPTPISRLNNFQPFQCNYQDRPKKCNNPKVCNLWHKSGVRYMRTCQPCPEVYPWTGKTGIKSSRIDNEIGE